MRKQISRVAASIGMTAGIVIIGGSVVGGIVLTSGHGDATTPSSTVSPAVESTQDGHGSPVTNGDSTSDTLDDRSGDGSGTNPHPETSPGTSDDSGSDACDQDDDNDDRDPHDTTDDDSTDDDSDDCAPGEH